MNDKTSDKKIQIIQAAMELFSQKGANSTSMQEIAERCGISKGSLYLVFKSKEELEDSVYLHCFRMIRDSLLAAEQATAPPPREKLRNQIEILLVHVFELREFLQRLIRDVVESGRTEPPDWLCKVAIPLTRWFEDRLETLYGREISAYSGDLMLLVHGMIDSCIRVIFHPGSALTAGRMADHLVRMLDIAAAGLLASRPEPLVSADELSALLVSGAESSRNNPFFIIRDMREKAKSAALSPEDLRDIMDSLAILENELLASQPRRAIVNGMLSNLRSCPELADITGELRELLTPQLL